MVRRIHLDEEGRTLLRQIVERQAYRQMMAANIRGHGLQFLPDLEDKILFTAELDFSLRVVREIARLYEVLGGGDLYQAVRHKMERIPYPESRLELAVCLALTDRAERIAASSYADSVCHEFSAVARTLREADRTLSRKEERVFADFCSEPSQIPLAQAFWDRWLKVALLSLGRPGTRGDERAVALGLRSLHAADVAGQFLDAVEELRGTCKLRMPDFEALGIELPTNLRGRYPAD